MCVDVPVDVACVLAMVGVAVILLETDLLPQVRDGWRGEG